MENNQEIIESRLAAYVDNELDPAERVEIEAHLEQNPQYGRLVEELRRGRDLLRSLPRETAPPEFAEAFSSQMERSGLLGLDEAPPRPATLRMMPSRLTAVAAIVALTAGLAVVVYFVLPDRHPRLIASNAMIPAAAAPSAAANEPEQNTPANTSTAGDVNSTNHAVAATGADSANVQVMSDAATHPSGAIAIAVSPAAAAKDLAASSRTEPVSPAPLPGATPAGPVAASPASAPALGTNSPAVARVRIASAASPDSLNSNSENRSAAIVSPMTANGPGGSAPGQLIARDRSARQTSPADRNSGTAPVNLDQLAKSAASNTSVRDLLLASDASTGPKALTPPSSDSAVVMAIRPQAAADVDHDLVAYFASNNIDFKPAPAAVQVALANSLDQSSAASASQVNARGNQRSYGELQSTLRKASGSSDVGQNLSQVGGQSQLRNIYLARRLSRSQTLALNSRLSQDGAVVQTDVLSLPQKRGGESNAAPASPAKGAAEASAESSADKDKQASPDVHKVTAAPAATQASDDQIRAGDTLRVAYAPDALGVARSEVVTVSSDGTVEAPALSALKNKPVMVAGKTLEDAVKSLQPPDSVAGADVPVDVPTVTKVEKLASATAENASAGPTTAPALGEKDVMKSPVAASLPTTQAVEDDHRLTSLDAVDVVIVVQNPVVEQQATPPLASPLAAPAAATPPTTPAAPLSPTPAPSVPQTQPASAVPAPLLTTTPTIPTTATPAPPPPPAPGRPHHSSSPLQGEDFNK